MKKRTRKILIVVSTLIILFSTVFQASAEMLLGAVRPDPNYGTSFAVGIPHMSIENYNSGNLLVDGSISEAVPISSSFDVVASAPAASGTYEASNTFTNNDYEADYPIQNQIMLSEYGHTQSEDLPVYWQSWSVNIHHEPDWTGGVIYKKQNIDVHVIMPNFYYDRNISGGALLYLWSYGASLASFTERYNVDMFFNVPGDFNTYRAELTLDAYPSASDYTEINLKALLLNSNLNLQVYRSTSVSDADYNAALQDYDPYLRDNANNDMLEEIVFGSLPTVVFIQGLVIEGVNADGTPAPAFGASVDNSNEDMQINSLYYDATFAFLYPCSDEGLFSELREVDLEYTGTDNYANASKYTKWIGHALSGFMDFQIMPGFSLGGLMLVILSFSVVVWWLKVFAGG